MQISQPVCSDLQFVCEINNSDHTVHILNPRAVNYDRSEVWAVEQIPKSEHVSRSLHKALSFSVIFPQGYDILWIEVLKMLS